MSVYNFTEDLGVSDTSRLESEPDAWETDPDFENHTVDPSRIASDAKQRPSVSNYPSKNVRQINEVVEDNFYQPPSQQINKSFCTQCGERLNYGSNFCSSCGARI